MVDEFRFDPKLARTSFVTPWDSFIVHVKSPQDGKPFGGFGWRVLSPSLMISAIPSIRCASIWQCRYQNPEKKKAFDYSNTKY